MKTLAIIGSSGMLGSDLVRFLDTKFRVTLINKQNYPNFIGSAFDIIINANGNSKRFWADSHPVEDFIVSTESVYTSIFDFKYHEYIYISSSDVYCDHTSARFTRENTLITPQVLPPYGLHKYLSELLIQKYVKHYLILRSSMILGKNLRKGPFYDIAHHAPLFISKDSRLQLITSRGIADIVQLLLKKGIYGQIYNIGGRGSFSFQDIKDYVHMPVTYSDDSEKQEYEMSVAKILKLYPLKTSEEYLREFLHGL